MKRVFWILITPILVFLILWNIGSWIVLPRVELWALEKIKNYSQSELPFNITADNIKIRVLRPSLTIENIKITANKNSPDSIAKIIYKTELKSLRVQLDVFQLLSGRLSFSTMLAENPELELNIDPLLTDETPAQELPLDDLFAITEKLPLPKILFQNIHIILNSNKEISRLEIQNGNILLTNMGRNLTAKINLPNLFIESKNYGSMNSDIESHLFLNRQALKILHFSAHLDQKIFPGSELSIQGEFTPIKLLTVRPSGVVNIEANGSLGDLFKEFKKAQPQYEIPKIAGTIHTEMEAHFKGKNDFQGKAIINTHGMSVDKWELGDARVQGEFNNHLVSFSEIQLKHPAGMATLNKSEIEFDHDFNFKSQIKLNQLDLQKLFVSLDLNEIPVGVHLEGDLPCTGKLNPEVFDITCNNAKLIATDLWVKSGTNNTSNAILELKHLTAQGKIEITPHAVSYKTEVLISDKNTTGAAITQGFSDGLIDFKNGFNINFKTNNLDFRNIQNLAQLKMTGLVSLDGHTEGNTNTATLSLQMTAQNFIFEQFNLGNVSTHLSLKKGHLVFEDILGLQNKTKYLGILDINLTENRLTCDISAPTAELSDISTILDPFYHFPVNLQGLGTLKAHVDGPLDFWKLNYKLESQFKKVSASQESFDHLTFNVSALNGQLETQKVQLQKNSSIIQLSGGIRANREMDFILDGKNLKLEELDTVTRFNSAIYGNLNFNSEIKGSVLNPLILLKGQITNSILGDQEIPSSEFSIRTDKYAFSTQVNLFGGAVKGEIQIPLEKDSSEKSFIPLLIKAKTDNWKFSNLLALAGGASLAADYDSALTSSIDLHSDTGDLLKSTGKIQIEKIFLKREEMSLTNPSTMQISINHGLMEIKNFFLQGPKNSISISGRNFTADRMNVTIEAKADLHLLQMFAPFLEDVGGPIEISASIAGPFTKPEIIGTANISETYVKIKGFPHIIEKISTDISFSQSKILVNEIDGQMAGGTISGDGSLIIKGIRNLQTSIQAKFENINLNVPDKVRSVGDAELAFSGSWFPFTLSGTYHIHQGLFEKEFTENTGGVADVKQSHYLPKVLREGYFEPVLLDLNINLDRPFAIKNSMFDGSVTGDLQVKGPPTGPLLFGKLTAERKSKLIFKDKLFDIQNAVVEFNTPDEINPQIFATATSRINEYDITLIAQGQSKNLNIKTSSVPPLSDQDIISLIALGVTSTSLSRTAGQQKAVAEQTGLEIGGAVLAKPINKQLESAIGFNLAVTSQYDSTRNISISKITLSKKISEKLKVSGSRPVGDMEGYDVKLEYLLNNNITAVGSFENKNLFDNTTLQNTPQEPQSIFGLDIEFKREFK
jgi:translocation and assembly module TamB